MPGQFGLDTSFNTVITANIAATLDFAIPRIGTLGYGYTGTAAYYNKTLSVDGGFAQSVQNMLAAGKYAGCYIFSYAWDVTSAQVEADRVCDKLDELGLDINFPVFFDWERTGPGTQGSYEMVTAAGVNVTASLVQNMTTAFMERCRARGRKAGWYNSSGDLDSWFPRSVIESITEQNYYLWVAQWSASTAYSDVADLWQYEGDTTYMGIGCDLNKALADRIFTDGPEPPQPTPAKKKFPIWLMLRPKYKCWR